MSLLNTDKSNTSLTGLKAESLLKASKLLTKRRFYPTQQNKKEYTLQLLEAAVFL